MKLLKQLTLADYVSLSGIVLIWLAIVSIVGDRPFDAIILTFGAFFVDMIDGWVARKTHSASNFGLQLDTIVDTINYPIFSALFAYQFIFDKSTLGSITAIIILIFGSLRLTRMAIDGIKKDSVSHKYYEGIVTPHILVANTFLFYFSFFVSQVPQAISAMILIPLSILMVSRIRIYKPDNLILVILFALLLLSISVFAKFLY
jgi:CDP-diacylglycerol---serine O-phosphatidyltransferase